jgi:hypothetical protein
VLAAARSSTCTLSMALKTDVDSGLTVTLKGGPSVKVSRRQSRRLRDELSL